MRRLFTAVALGLLWTGAACAQEPAVYGEDYTPADPVWPFPLYSTHSDNGALDAFLTETLAGVPQIHAGAGQNVDGSWYSEVVRARSRLGWDDLFTPKPDQQTSRCDTPIRPGTFEWDEGPSYIDMLNALCFLEVLSAPKLGPDMDPHFNEPRDSWVFWGGWF